MMYLELFIEFFLIGAFTFGGGYAMLPLIYQTVLENGWLSEAQLIDFIAISESTPGPLAINMSTFVGVRMEGLLGAIVAMLGVVLPSFIVITIVAKFYEAYRKSKVMSGAMVGLKPAVVALIATSVISLSKNVIDYANLLTKENLISFVIIVVAGVLCYKKKSPIIIISISAALGIIMGVL